MTATVVFRACAPTQSWGVAGNASDNRPTATHPLQAAVTGLIGAALGLPRNDQTTIARISAATMTFRLDRPGTIRNDYQTIQNTINTDSQPRGTIISRRGELQDACTTVFCTWDDDHIARDIANALRFPRWPLHLGRRCHLVGSFPETALAAEPVSDDLLGSWAPCPIHPPNEETWTVVEDTLDPLNAEGVTLTGTRAFNFAHRNHTVAPVRTRQIPRLPPRTGDNDERTVLVDGSGVVLTRADEAD